MTAQNKKAVVAVDLGAQSCRVTLLRWVNGRPEIHLLQRFSNGPIDTGSGLRWDIRRIVAGVEDGLRLCARAAPEGIASVGVDGWGVDYVRLGEDGKPLGDPYCHRDQRTTGAMAEVLRKISANKLYALTGIQLLELNTLFQLYADHLAGIDPQARWLNLPEYITWLLGGRPVSEYTNATHTQMVRLGTQEWCGEIFAATGLAKSAAPPIVSPGTVVGKAEGELGQLSALREAKLIVPACHDTASAIAAIPATGDDWAFISSGTWSLVGTVLGSPCVTDDARRMNFTNLGGVGGTMCFLKNINGMWLLRECMDEWERAGHAWTLRQLIEQCERLSAPQTLIDVDEAPLLRPGDMPAKINALIQAQGGQPLAMDGEGIPRMANIIFYSLARRYAEVLQALASVTGKELKRLFIVGGGSKNGFLNRLTEERTGLQVIPGSSECTTIGNFAIQLAALDGKEASREGVTREAVARYAEKLSANALTIAG